jgi:hypothetical protein
MAEPIKKPSPMTKQEVAFSGHCRQVQCECAITLHKSQQQVRKSLTIPGDLLGGVANLGETRRSADVGRRTSMECRNLGDHKR